MNPVEPDGMWEALAASPFKIVIGAGNFDTILSRNSLKYRFSELRKFSGDPHQTPSLFLPSYAIVISQV
jgi:hypothetical protein